MSGCFLFFRCQSFIKKAHRTHRTLDSTWAALVLLPRLPAPFLLFLHFAHFFALFAPLSPSPTSLYPFFLLRTAFILLRKPSFVSPFSCTRCLPCCLPHCREVPCSFFAQGRCRHGGNCRFFHTPAVPGANESAALLCDSGSVQWRPLARIVNASNHRLSHRRADETPPRVRAKGYDGHGWVAVHRAVRKG